MWTDGGRGLSCIQINSICLIHQRTTAAMDGNDLTITCVTDYLSPQYILDRYSPPNQPRTPQMRHVHVAMAFMWESLSHHHLMSSTNPVMVAMWASHSSRSPVTEMETPLLSVSGPATTSCAGRATQLRQMSA
jgi:hypothetical protein